MTRPLAIVTVAVITLDVVAVAVMIGSVVRDRPRMDAAGRGLAIGLASVAGLVVLVALLLGLAALATGCPPRPRPSVRAWRR